MLYLIGIGLGGVEDISSDVVNILKSCQKIYLETYTSVVLNADGEFNDIVYDLKQLIDSDAEYFTADREMVESGSQIVNSVKSGYMTAFLVVGDSLSSATHTDLIIRALDEGLTYKIFNNTSIMTAISCSGLRLKQFSQTVSIPFWDNGVKQPSILDKIESNLRRGKHTLCLLDIKVKEKTIENIVRDRPIYEPPRFMKCSTAATQLLECLEDENAHNLTAETLCVGMARVGCSTERIFVGTLSEVALYSDETLGGPLHSLLITGECNERERLILDSIGKRRRIESQLCIVGVDARSLQSLSVAALETLQSCSRVCLEVYTQLVNGAGMRIVSDMRDMLSDGVAIDMVDIQKSGTAVDIVKSAKNGTKTALVVLGDPMSFSNHTDIALLAMKEDVGYSIHHSTSIQTAVGRCGLQLVSFDTVTIPLSNNDSDNYIDSIKQNLRLGLHTLCLLPIKVCPDSSLSPMTCGIAATRLMEGLCGQSMSAETMCVGMAKLGCVDERIIVSTLGQVATLDHELGKPIHCLVIVGHCHDLELAFLKQFAMDSNPEDLYENHIKVNFSSK